MRCLSALLVFILLSCHPNPNPNIKIVLAIKNDSIAPKINVEHYPELKKNIARIVKTSHPENFTPAYSKLFIDVVIDSIIPYWYGTKWNFYGDTETPQNGTIACGYFVTTVLRDAGVPVNRIKLAQCASEVMITQLVSKKLIKRYSNMALRDFISDIKFQGKGLYLVGLDNHTGFLLCDDYGVWFIHSSYVTPGCVAKQDASNNSILYYSKYKVTGKISSDEAFLLKWVKNL